MGRSRTLLLRDAVVPLAIALLGTVELLVLDPPAGLVQALVAEWAACAVLVPRRRLPLVAATLGGVLILPLPFVGPPQDEHATPILIGALAAFSLGRCVGGLRGIPSMVLFAVVLLGDYLFTVDDPLDVTDAVFVGALLLPPYGFGLVMRTLAERNERLARQAELLLQLQETVKREAVSAERARIARELHDVVAHSVSAMVVQASAAEDLVAADPERAATALRDVTSTGRRALAETGRLLHLIRDTDDEMGLAPDLGMDRLGELVEQFRRSGLDVDLTVEGPLDALPAGVDVSGYRIVQEALTNALRYAADRAATVRVRRSPTTLLIDAENRGIPGGAGGAGLGLVGMAERVSVFGGSLTHGYTGDGRFVLRAIFPIAAADA